MHKGHKEMRFLSLSFKIYHHSPQSSSRQDPAGISLCPLCPDSYRDVVHFVTIFYRYTIRSQRTRRMHKGQSEV